MNIRARLTLTFFGIVIVVLTAISVAIYYFSADHRQQDFYRRLKNRAMNAARVLMVEDVKEEVFDIIEGENPASLPQQYIVIFNSKDVELYASREVPGIPVNSDLLRRLEKESEFRYKHEHLEVLAFVFNDKAERFKVVAAATDLYGADALKNLRRVLIITFCISVIFVSMIGWIYAGKVLSPISKIVNEVSEISEVNLNQRVDEGNKKDELGKLARTFNRMLERLQSAFVAQKSFIANASHEIKTPITVMSGHIEVTLLQERDKATYVAILNDVLDGLKGLNKLSTQLLLLAQTSADQPDKNFRPIRIDDVLWEVKDELEKVNPEYSINIVLEIGLDDHSLMVHGDEQLVRAAVANLMDNGCKYSSDNHVTVNLLSKRDDFVSAEFVNNGKGIDGESMSKIFEPFYRGKNPKKVKGFGIGLSLVKTIVRLHGGSIVATSQPDGETRFTMTFPLTPHATA